MADRMSTAEYGAQARATGYGVATTAPSVPKEIGFLQRVEGMNTGLADIFSRLESLEARIYCQPSNAGGAEQSRPAGLPACLGEMEGRIRETLVLIGRLENAF